MWVFRCFCTGWPCRSRVVLILAFRGESKRPLTRRGAAPLCYASGVDLSPTTTGGGTGGTRGGFPHQDGGEVSHGSFA